MRVASNIEGAVARARLVLTAFGWKGIVRRLGYVGRLRSGWLRRRMPMVANFDAQPRARWDFSFDVAEVRHRYEQLRLPDETRAQVLADADRLLAGEVRLYGWAWREVSWPPRWQLNPFTGAEYPAMHWTDISDDDPERGDIKDVWELSRLGFTCLLARAYLLSSDDRYPDAWWQAVEDWMRRNPPNTGVNWRCGQETSLRAIAVGFGVSTFSSHPSTTPARRAMAEQLLGASARRVRPTVGYALSQRNNHAISELTFLLSLPGGPNRRLCRLLGEAIDDQFYPDGSYGQQSFVYHRLALQALVWLLQVQPDLPADLDRAIRSAIGRSAQFWHRCSDPLAGSIPNYGPNDGSLLFDLSSCGHLDAGPTLALAGILRISPLAAEIRCWFDAIPSGRADQPASPEPESTYRTMRGPRSLLLTRVGVESHRPADDDQQAVELFIDGQRVVLDPGTFRYSGRPPWRNPFTLGSVHSVPTPTRADERLAVGRFLRSPMPSARVVHHDMTDESEILVSRRRQADTVLTRAIVRADDRFAIFDRAEGDDAVVRWNLATDSCEFDLHCPSGAESLPRDDNDPASGWWSPSYAQLAPVEALQVSLTSGATAIARFGPKGAKLLDVGWAHARIESWLSE